ncbi:MAG TPA: hypothetical protein PKZ84_06515 [Anaerolineae bacterium]|nr:hypothetical protein [Anaerolineae bacterium]HQI83339.1 hypothetical protein [Anaerolineae bacterium]
MLIRRTFTLDTQRDATLLAWLDAQDNQSETVRAALRNLYDASQVTLADVYRAVQAVEQRLADGVAFNAAASDPTPVEDPDLADALDHLGL